MILVLVTQQFQVSCTRLAAQITSQLSCVTCMMSAVSPLTAPAPVCDVRPVSANGVITVTWGYTHTGGLEITEVIVQYGIHSSGPIDFQDIPNGNLTDPSQQTLVVSGLIAGKAYVFRVTASNNIGPASVDCLPVIHFVGELRCMCTRSTVHESCSLHVHSYTHPVMCVNKISLE